MSEEKEFIFKYNLPNIRGIFHVSVRAKDEKEAKNKFKVAYPNAISVKLI